MLECDFVTGLRCARKIAAFLDKAFKDSGKMQQK
jgi:hypothetical protein